MVWHGEVLRGIAWLVIARHDMAWLWHGMIWLGMAWYGVARYGVVCHAMPCDATPKGEVMI